MLAQNCLIYEIWWIAIQSLDNEGQLTRCLGLLRITVYTHSHSDAVLLRLVVPENFNDDSQS